MDVNVTIIAGAGVQGEGEREGLIGWAEEIRSESKHPLGGHQSRVCETCLLSHSILVLLAHIFIQGVKKMHRKICTTVLSDQITSKIHTLQFTGRKIYFACV